MAGWVAET
uniref:Uncharacterized protein n=1 Tax=Arundo donax TaxID=35708 RepID=A0A0A9B140_ARUDO